MFCLVSFFGCFVIQRKSNSISVAIRFPQASAIFSVVSIYSKIVTWKIAAPLRHFSHPLSASHVVLEPGATTAWSPWRNDRVSVGIKSKEHYKSKQ